MTSVIAPCKTRSTEWIHVRDSYYEQSEQRERNDWKDVLTHALVRYTYITNHHAIQYIWISWNTIRLLIDRLRRSILTWRRKCACERFIIINSLQWFIICLHFAFLRCSHSGEMSSQLNFYRHFLYILWNMNMIQFTNQLFIAHIITNTLKYELRFLRIKVILEIYLGKYRNQGLLIECTEYY